MEHVIKSQYQRTRRTASTQIGRPFSNKCTLWIKNENKSNTKTKQKTNRLNTVNNLIMNPYFDTHYTV